MRIIGFSDNFMKILYSSLNYILLSLDYSYVWLGQNKSFNHSLYFRSSTIIVNLLLCIRYLVLANMLMESEVNPFDGQEAKP